MPVCVFYSDLVWVHERCWARAQVVKQTGAKLQMRTVQPANVAQWAARIGALEKDIVRIGLVSKRKCLPGMRTPLLTLARNSDCQCVAVTCAPPKHVARLAGAATSQH